MTGKDIVKKLMEEENVTNAQLANKLGLTQATMWARLNYQSSKDLPLTVFNEMLEALGYEMVIRKKTVDNSIRKEMTVELDVPTKEEGRGRPKTRA